jgi:hypothetical protein
MFCCGLASLTCTGTVFSSVNTVSQVWSSYHISRNREAMLGVGSAATVSAAEDEPGWEYHVGSMGRHVVISVLYSISGSYRLSAHFKGLFLISKWWNGSSRQRNRHSIDRCSIHYLLIFVQGFFNSTEMFLRRAGDRLFVSSSTTDLSSFFE